MNATSDHIQFAMYGPDHFAEHLPFGRLGYLFTVPGAFPDDTPAHTNPTDWTMAVYRTRASGAECWEVRDVDGLHRVWAEAETRRKAVGMAFAEISRLRHLQAAEIARRRVDVLGLEAVPPYEVEVTTRVTLVITPDVVAHLRHEEPAEPGRPKRYRVVDPDGGDEFVITDGERVSVHELSVGVLHIRCACNPEVAARFETKPDALAYVRESLPMFWTCPKSPGAPAGVDQQHHDPAPVVQ